MSASREKKSRQEQTGSGWNDPKTAREAKERKEERRTNILYGTIGVVFLLVAIAGRLVRKLCHFAGFGIADIVLGIAVSVLKYMLLLSVLFSAFDTLNEDYTLIGARTIEKSKSYKPVMRLSERIFPFLEWVGEQVPQQAREQDEE